MARLDPAELRALVARADLPEMIGRVVTLKRTGRSFLGKCPFHDERSPSFSVYQTADAGWRFKCHAASCGERGDALDWLTRYEALPFGQALAILNGGEMPGGGVHRPVDVETLERRRQAAAKAEARERDRAGVLWRLARRADGTAVETYLREARGLGALAGIPRVLRCVDTGLWDTSETRPREVWHGPAMIAVIQDAAGHGMGVHLTFLEPDGAGKLATADRGLVDPGGAPLPVKKMRGNHMGGAMRLTAIGSLSSPLVVLAAGEGIETSLSVHVAAGLPAWAAASLENLAGPAASWAEGAAHPRIPGRLLPPVIPDMDAPGFPWRNTGNPNIDVALLLGDGDTKDLDFLTAKLERGAKRAARLGLTARVAMSREGFDFNDLLKAAPKEVA
jgi:CHC2 zinc finger